MAARVVCLTIGSSGGCGRCCLPLPFRAAVAAGSAVLKSAGTDLLDTAAYEGLLDRVVARRMK